MLAYPFFRKTENQCTNLAEVLESGRESELERKLARRNEERKEEDEKGGEETGAGEMAATVSFIPLIIFCFFLSRLD